MRNHMVSNKEVKHMANNKVFGLCEGRHPIEGVSEYIFPNTLDVLDIKGMEKMAEAKLEGCSSVTIYVTGLTVALTAVLTVAIWNGISVKLMHFNRETGEYYPQQVVSFDYCGFCGSPMLRNGYSWGCPHCGAT